jgi:hypothetical protein
MTDETCTLELTPRELALLLKYGLPFDDDGARALVAGARRRLISDAGTVSRGGVRAWALRID